MTVLMGGFLLLLSHVLRGLSWGGGMVDDESDSCISERLQNVHTGIQLPSVHICEQALSISSAIIPKLI